MNKFQRKVAVDAKRWDHVYNYLKGTPKNKMFRGFRKSFRKYFKLHPDHQHVKITSL